MMSLLRHFQSCNDAEKSDFFPFFLGDVAVGRVHHHCRAKLQEFFPELEPFQGGLSLPSHDFATRTLAIANFGKKLVENGNIRRLKGENFTVLPFINSDQTTALTDELFAKPLALIDRKIVPFLGVQGFGVHLNGIIRNQHGDITHLWIARRSSDRAVAPGKLDNMVGGGQGAYFTPLATLVKEAEEEAGLSADFVKTAIASTPILYRKKWDLPNWGTGLRNDFLSVFDIDMPGTLSPHNQDGEISEFFPMSLAEIIDALENSDDFKFNVALIQIDFLLRHGFITSQHPEYSEIIGFRNL